MRYIENIWSKFDQVIPVVSHFEVSIINKHIAPNHIGDAIKVPQKQILKEALFVKYDNNKYSTFFWITCQSNTSIMEQRSSVHLFLQVSSNETVPIHVDLL